MDLQLLKQKIIDHPYFQKTKDVVENNECHKNEKVYDHLLSTSKRAEEIVDGKFIPDKKAREMFENWMNEEKFGIKQKDISILAALLHDIGKILVFEENNQTHSINQIQKNGMTLSLGHEYWGSTIVSKILTDVGLSTDVVYYVSMIVKLHGLLMFPKFDKSKSILDHISDMKTLGQGMEKEILFNIYVDVAKCEMFGDWLKIIEQMFGNTELYKKRKYIIS